MKTLTCFLLLITLAACSDYDSMDGVESATDEPPFFVASKTATGPLTLSELQINIPDELDSTLSEGTRACFFAAVEQLAEDAGDPADIDPNAFPYWGGEVSPEQWADHSRYMQRVLLAQAIVSWAMVDC